VPGYKGLFQVRATILCDVRKRLCPTKDPAKPLIHTHTHTHTHKHTHTHTHTHRNARAYQQHLRELGVPGHHGESERAPSMRILICEPWMEALKTEVDSGAPFDLQRLTL
jgi:hypothetical protein